MAIYVVDQNRMRKQELQDIIEQEPEARFVIPDVAFVEMSKHANWEYTMRLSLAPLIPVIERTFLSLSVGEAMKVEFASRRPIDSAALLPNQFQGFVRSLIDEFDQGRDGPSKRLIHSGFENARSSLLVQELDAEKEKSKILSIVESWSSALKPEMLKALRSNVYGDKFRLSYIQVTVDVDFFHQVTNLEGLSESQSEDFMSTRPMVLRYLYLLVRHAVNWVIASGLSNVDPKKELNHLLDMEYAAIATFLTASSRKMAKQARPITN